MLIRRALLRGRAVPLGRDRAEREPVADFHGPPTEAGSPLVIAQQLLDRVGKRRDILRRHEETVDAMAHDISRAVIAIAGDDGAPEGHRLEQRHRQSFEPGGEDEDGRRQEHLLGRARFTGKRDALDQVVPGSDLFEPVALVALTPDHQARGRP